MEKQCNVCKITKSIDNFTKNTGLKSHKKTCKECINEKNKSKDRTDYLHNYYLSSKEDINILNKKKEVRKRSNQRPERKLKNNLNSKNYFRSLKREVIKEYGGKCCCCGITMFEFLTIDHISNNGNTHRKEIGKGRIYPWLKRNGYPKDNFQLLCMNCNSAKGFYKMTIKEIQKKLKLNNKEEDE